MNIFASCQYIMAARFVLSLFESYDKIILGKRGFLSSLTGENNESRKFTTISKYYNTVP